MKLFGQTIKREVKPSYLKRQIKIERDGEQVILKEGEIVKYLQDIFDGGKTLTLAEKEMIKDGLKNEQWERREEIIKLLEDIATNDS